MTVRLSREDIIAITRARDSLRAEEVALARWGMHSTQLSLAVSDMDSLVSRLEDEKQLIRRNIMAHNDYPEVTVS